VVRADSAADVCDVTDDVIAVDNVDDDNAVG